MTTFPILDKISRLHYILEVALAAFSINILAALYNEPSILLFFLALLAFSAAIISFLYKTWRQRKLDEANSSKSPTTFREQLFRKNMKIILPANIIVLVFLTLVVIFYSSFVSNRYNNQINSSKIISDIQQEINNEKKIVTEMKATLADCAKEVSDINTKIDAVVKTKKESELREKESKRWEGAKERNVVHK